MLRLKKWIYGSMCFISFFPGLSELLACSRDISSVVIDDVGNITVICDNIVDTVRVISSSSLSGGIWTSPTPISTYPTKSSDAQKIAVNAKGDIVVSWVSSDQSSGSQTLEVAKLPLGGVWTLPVVVSASNESLTHMHNVLLSDDGTIILTWISRSSDTGLTNVRGITGQFDGDWNRPLTIMESTPSTNVESKT